MDGINVWERSIEEPDLGCDCCGACCRMLCRCKCSLHYYYYYYYYVPFARRKESFSGERIRSDREVLPFSWIF